MRVSRFFLVGLSGGSVAVRCETFGCDFAVFLPANSTLLDVEQRTKAHTHPTRRHRKEEA